MSGIMSQLVGSPKATTIAGFRVQTSVYGVPIPIVYGLTRVSGNLIHMPKTPTLNGGTSKLSRVSKGSQSGENYFAPLVLALCEGPIQGIANVWRDKDLKVDFTAKYAPTWTIKLGTSSQTPWSYLSSNYPAQAVPYQFTAYVANDNLALPSDSLSQYSWEIQGFLPFNAGGGISDASPADILNDLLTNAQYGAGFAPAQVGSITTFQNYCAAAGLFCSPCIDSQKPGADWINEICEVGNCALVWSDGLLKFIPYGDVPLSGNGHTYTPNTTPEYDLTDSHFLPRGGDLDPIQVTRTDPSTAYNQVTVEYRDRALDYNNSTYTAQDQAAIDAYGVIALPNMQLYSICTAQIAQQVAQMRLQREQNVRNTYAFKLGWRFSLLEPMDLVTLTDPGLGLNLTPVRIISITEGANEQGFDVVAEEWPFGTASATQYTVPNPTGTLPNANVDPGNTATPIIAEAPPALKTSPLDLMLAASGGPNWGGCDVYIATDNVNFSKVGRIIGAAAMGTLTASLPGVVPVWPAVDTTSTLAVDITASGRTLSSYSATDFANLVPACYVGGEWCAFETAALASAGHYNLTSLYRAIFNTVVGSHASGTPFFLLDSAVARIPWPLGQAGQTIYVKLPAFNIYGAQLQDVSAVSSTAYTIAANPTQFQNAAPQGTVAIDKDGNWAATADGPSGALSYRYAASSLGFPADSGVITTGTIVSGRSFSVTGGPLNFGDTIYLTIIPFTADGANGKPLPSIHLRGSYLSFTASKTAIYSPSGWIEVTNPPWGFTFDLNNAYIIQANLGVNTNVQYWNLYPVLPSGVTVTGVHVDMNWVSPSTFDMNFRLMRIVSGVGTSLGGNSGSGSGGGWQSPFASYSESTTGRSYQVRAEVDGGNLGEVGNVSITYTMPNPKQAL